MNTSQVVRYSASSAYAYLATFLVAGFVWLTLGIVNQQTLVVVTAIVWLCVVAAALPSIMRRRGAVALAREGQLLVGSALKQPLPIDETTFETTSDHNGSWVFRLYCRDQTVRLAAIEMGMPDLPLGGPSDLTG